MLEVNPSAMVYIYFWIKKIGKKKEKKGKICLLEGYLNKPNMRGWAGAGQVYNSRAIL